MNIHQISGDGQWEHFSKKGEKLLCLLWSRRNYARCHHPENCLQEKRSPEFITL